MDTEKKSLGETLFSLRDYTPIPLVLFMLFMAKPTVISVTIGLFSIILGEMIRIYSVSFIGSISRTRSSSLGEQLITQGPFAVVRNPLYIGNFFIAIGVVAYSGLGWLVVLTALLFVFQYHNIVQYEEELLLSKFGDQFLDYKDKVPAWFPKNKLSLESFASISALKPALQSESRTITAIVVLISIMMLLTS